MYKRQDSNGLLVAYGFLRNNLNEPAFSLPAIKSSPLCVRFCPLLFKRMPADKPFIDLPYILVFAIATQESVMIYTTKSVNPIAIISQIHHAELTDLTWSMDKKLCVSSRDGFVTLVHFEENEFGEKMLYEEIPETVKHCFDWMVDYRDIEAPI